MNRLIKNTGVLLTLLFCVVSAPISANDYNGKMDKKDLVLIDGATMVYRHKDPHVSFLFTNDADGDIFKVIFDFEVLGFGTTSGKAPIDFQAIKELVVVYRTWLASARSPQGETLKNINRALYIASGDKARDDERIWNEGAEMRREQEEYNERHARVFSSGSINIGHGRDSTVLWDSLRAPEQRVWTEVDAETRKLKVTKSAGTEHFALNCSKAPYADASATCSLSIKNYDHFYFGDLHFIAEFGGTEATQIANLFQITERWERRDFQGHGPWGREASVDDEDPRRKGFEQIVLRTHYQYPSEGDADIPVFNLIFYKRGNEVYVHVQKYLLGARISDMFGRKIFELIFPRTLNILYRNSPENPRLENPHGPHRGLFFNPLDRNPPSRRDWRSDAVRDPTGP